jgi:hypothetical protein
MLFTSARCVRAGERAVRFFEWLRLTVSSVLRDRRQTARILRSTRGVNSPHETSRFTASRPAKIYDVGWKVRRLGERLHCGTARRSTSSRPAADLSLGQGRLPTPNSESDRDCRGRSRCRPDIDARGHLRKRSDESQSPDALFVAPSVGPRVRSESAAAT